MQSGTELYKLGRSFELNKSIADRKEKGVFYTPEAMVDFVLEEIMEGIDLSANPYVRILDPACGVGYFLLKAYNKLRDKFLESFDGIMDSNPDLRGKVTRDSIGVFIAENNIWGADIDPEAVRLVEAQLRNAAECECNVNIRCCDSLTDAWEGHYDYVIGDPPYIGHKGVSIEYRKQLQQLYGGIYIDKSDISYCFIKRGMDLLKEGGKLAFVVSRYFMEGPSASGLRKSIDENCTVVSITDFFGKQVFEDAGIDVCILTLEKGIRNIGTRVTRHNQTELKGEPATGLPESFSVSRSQLRAEGWMLVTPDRFEIFSAIQENSTHSLGDLFNSHQGIITGCDKAFVLNKAAVEEHRIEKELLKPWIKNSDVERYGIKPAQYSMIYSDLIEDVERYPNALKYIDRYRDKLLNRRECKKGFRQWYQLQWGRRQENFEERKLVYPYKASSNRFALDEEGCYCSADVYSLILKERFKPYISYECLCAVLNSKLVEFYFKCYAKKMSGRLYDYYPNTVLRIRLNVDEIAKKLEAVSKQLFESRSTEEKNHAERLVDKELYNIYGLSAKQIEIIEKEVGNDGYSCL